jgi:hypothetical protein
MKSFLSTRLTSIGFVIVLSIALFLSTKGNSQDARITQLRKGYQECVYDAVASQLKGNSQVINASAATELAFRACSTEEQAILAHVYAAGVSQTDANQVITSFKLSLKQTVRNIINHPPKYAPQPSSAPPDIPPPRGGCASSYKRYDGATVYTNCN